jgi:hypothetical protein
MPRNTRDVISEQLAELNQCLERTKDREAARESELRWLLRELRFARVRLPITEQLRIEELQQRLGV